MCSNTLSDRARGVSVTDSIERYLQDKGKGRGGDGGNYRRNAARELERFGQWTAGDRGRESYPMMSTAIRWPRATS